MKFKVIHEQEQFNGGKVNQFFGGFGRNLIVSCQSSEAVEPCKGLTSNYKTAVGRSRSIEGPYMDKEGKPMTECGGEILIGATPEYNGVGHCSVYNMDGKWYFISHAYDRNLRGASKLFLRELHWQDGWPTLP